MQTRAKATIRDVAKLAGVSKSLVSMVIRREDRVSPERRAAVLKAAAQLNYRPNAMARGLVQRQTRILGVMINDLRNPFFADVVSGIQQQAALLGYRVLFTSGDRRPELEEEAIESLLELWVDGLILAGPRVEDRTISAAGLAAPLVALNRPTTEEGSDSVTNDDFAGAELAVAHCASLGHIRIAHIDGGAGAGAKERREGYENAMHRRRLEQYSLVVAGGFTEAPGYRGAQELLAKRPLPTAIFAANDLCAFGAMSALEEAGLSIPTDISLIGYDDTSLAALRNVSLSSINQPGAKMGRMAAEWLFERIGNGRTQARHEVVSPSLVVRNSTAPPPRELHTER